MPTTLTSKILIVVGAAFLLFGMFAFIGPVYTRLSPLVVLCISLISLTTLLTGVVGWASRQPTPRLLRVGLVLTAVAAVCVFLIARAYNGPDNTIGLLLLALVATLVLIDLTFLAVGTIYRFRQRHEREGRPG
jgi:hypothetical protein